MRALLAELVDVVAEQNKTEKELLIQTEALNQVVAAIIMQLDDTARVQLKDKIHEAFHVEHGGDSSHTAERRMLQCAVEELFTFQKGCHQKR